MRIQMLEHKQIKNEPDLEAITVGVVKQGQKIKAEPQEGGWYKIGEQQYISEKYTVPLPTITTKRKETE